MFGGTFDPIHRGHLAIAQFALQEAELDLVLMVPAGRPWLRDEAPMASAEHRLRMTQLAVENEPNFEVSGVDVVREGATYTVDTLVDLGDEYGEDVEFVLVLGADSARQMDSWERSDELRRLCSVLVIGRPGEERLENLAASHPAYGARYLEGPMLDVSATRLRSRLAAGEDVSDSVPGAVERYIRKNGLYGA